MTLNLNELKQLAEEATLGPWERDCSGICGGYLAAAEICVASHQMPHARQVANLDYIAAANPATILALIERIQEAETRNALQQRALDEMRATMDADAGRQVTAEHLLRHIYKRPDLTQQGRESFISEMKDGDVGLSVCWGDFCAMAELVSQLRPTTNGWIDP